MAWWDGLATPPVEGGWQMGSGNTGGLLASNSQLYPYLGDLGAGLLASSGPSLTPQGGLGARFGKAIGYAGERQSERTLNDARRAEIADQALRRSAEGELRAAIAAGDDAAAKAAAGRAYPELVAKSMFPQPMDPRDQAAIMQTQATLAEIQQRIKENTAGAATPSAATARAVSTLADVFDTAEAEGSPFAPGATFGSESTLGKAGLNPSAIVSAPDQLLKPFGDPATLKRQAGQAILIDKETATISQNLTQLAEKGSGRSATALTNLNTSLGAGNVPIPVRRKVILSTLETVIDDVTARGNAVEPEWITLRDRLREQTKNITKGGAEGAAAFSPPPTQGYSPGAGFTPQPAPTTTITPQPGVPNRSVSAGAGPAPAPVTTFKRWADVKRAEASGKLSGVTSITVDGKTYDWVP